jgi:CspA family cold shock protein
VVSLVPNELHDEVRALQRALGFDGELTVPFSGRPPATRAAAARPPTPGTARRQSSAPTTSRRPTRAPANARRPSSAPSAPRHRSGDSGQLTGTVKFFDTSRGFGFLSHPDGSEVFVHHSTIRGSNKRMLRTGDRVHFELAIGRRGHEARNVTAAASRGAA